MPHEMKDMIVLLPGILGSELKKDGKVVWGFKASVMLKNLLSGGKRFEKDLLLHDPDQDDGIVATRLLPDLHLIPGLWKVDGYSRIIKSLEKLFDLTEGRNFHTFPYDWRRDNRRTAKLLETFIGDRLKAWRESSGNADAKVILIAHSMGGLVSRYYLEVLGGFRDTRALFTFGTPYRGSVLALKTLGNGVKVYPPVVKPITVKPASRVARSLPSLYQLRPTYRCWIEDEKRIGLKDANKLPTHVDAARMADALAFHDETQDAAGQNGANYKTFTATGFVEKTSLTGWLSGDGGVLSSRKLDGREWGGDGTVPRFSSNPTSLIPGIQAMFGRNEHGSIQNAKETIAHLEGALTEFDIDGTRFSGGELNLDIQDLYLKGDPVIVRASAPIPLSAVAVDLWRDGQVVAEDIPTTTDFNEEFEALLNDLPVGDYTVRCRSLEGAATEGSFAVLDMDAAEIEGEPSGDTEGDVE